jgi:fructose-bisphosphate aldolase class II
MVLVTNAYLLKRADEGGYAVGAFNANNMEMIQAIIETAEEEKAPVILQASQGAIKYAGLDFIVVMVKTAAEKTKIPVSLHLDHGTDYEQNIKCLRAGFTSLMYDGSSKPFDENVTITKKLVEIAHAVGVSVEAELGKIGGTEDNIVVSELEATMTDPNEAKKFVELTKVDSLAVAVGTVHRMKTRTAKLDFDRIAKIKKAVGIPLVLHGASGVPDDGVKKAIAAGIRKINIATELNKSFVNAVAKAIRDMPDEVDPRKMLTKGKEATKAAVREKIRLFGCEGKA